MEYYSPLDLDRYIHACTPLQLCNHDYGGQQAAEEGEREGEGEGGGGDNDVFVCMPSSAVSHTPHGSMAICCIQFAGAGVNTMVRGRGKREEGRGKREEGRARGRGKGIQSLLSSRDQSYDATGHGSRYKLMV